MLLVKAVLLLFFFYIVALDLISQSGIVIKRVVFLVGSFRHTRSFRRIQKSQSYIENSLRAPSHFNWVLTQGVLQLLRARQGEYQSTRWEDDSIGLVPGRTLNCL